jgi:Domain of unknown function (DUF4352)
MTSLIISISGIKINNAGDHTYSTNSGDWHLKIGDMYYQHDSTTYDSSLNHMTTDVGPGGKITTKMAYIVDGEPSISGLELYMVDLDQMELYIHNYSKP